MKKMRQEKKHTSTTTVSQKTLLEEESKAEKQPPRIDRKHSSVVIHPTKVETEANEGFIANLNMILDLNSSGGKGGYRNDLQQLFLAMLLCHEATTIYKYTTDEYLFESKSNIEQALLNFAHLCGFTFDTEPSFDEYRVFKTKIKVFCRNGKAGEREGVWRGMNRQTKLLLRKKSKGVATFPCV